MKRVIELWESKLKDIFAVFGFTFVWVVFFFILFSYVPIYNWGQEVTTPFTIPRNKIYDFVSACVIAPLVEELMFRVAPVMILEKLKLVKKVGLEIMFLVSLIFGFMHGGNINIFIQGIGGIGFSYLYLKQRSYWSVVFVHFLWNFMWGYALPFLT